MKFARSIEHRLFLVERSNLLKASNLSQRKFLLLFCEFVLNFLHGLQSFWKLWKERNDKWINKYIIILYLSLGNGRCDVKIDEEEFHCHFSRFNFKYRKVGRNKTGKEREWKVDSISCYRIECRTKRLYYLLNTNAHISDGRTGRNKEQSCS